MERDPIVVEVRDVAFGGKGVARLPSGKTVFVADVIAGERAAVRVVKDGRRIAEAELEELLEVSPRRVRPPCPYFGSCGGCAYQHMAYDLQLEVKRQQVSQTLRRIGGCEVDVAPTIGSPKPFHYRNRITVHCRGGRVGFYGRDGRTVVDIERCLLASDRVNDLLREFRLERRGFDGVRTLREHADRSGFHQTNDAVAEILLESVVRACGTGEVLIDAYCGSGFFARRMIGQFERVIGIEWNGDAIRKAQEGAAPNEVYLEGDVARRITEVLPASGSGGPNIVVLDPPAQGVDPLVIEALIDSSIDRIVYVSCDPATLGRDVKMLSAVYAAATAEPFDMFAQTAEVEVVCVLERKRSDAAV